MDENENLLEGNQEENKKTDENVEEFVFDGEGIPEEIKGKKASDVVSLIGEYKDNITRSLEENKQLKTELSETTRKVDELAHKILTGQTDKENREPEEESITNEDFFNDPQKAIDSAVQKALSQVEQKLNPYMDMVTGSVRNQAKMLASSNQYYNDFKDEITRTLDSVPENIISTPEGVETAINLAIAGNIPKLIEVIERNKKQRKIIPNISGGTSVGGGDKNKSKDLSLSSEEKGVAQKMVEVGVFKDISEYAKWR